MVKDVSKKRIFVQIASYRDPECVPTVADLFAKAAQPERISVGICWQYDPVSEKAATPADFSHPKQVQVSSHPIAESQGAGWARNVAQAFWNGEDFVLQIQAHMRFEPNWDETLITMLERCPTEKSILTAWLPGYVPPDKKLPLGGKIPLSVVSRLGNASDAQMMHLIKKLVPAGTLYGKLIPTCSWVGNFLFARAALFKEVPFDPHIYFWGEEVNFTTRAWTHGYDFYHLDRIVLYHFWDRPGAKDSRIYRDHNEPRNRRSLMRNRHLLGIEETKDANVVRDLAHYGLGTVRRLNDYWKFAGFNLKQGTVTRKAKDGAWVMGDIPAARGPSIFVSIASYRDPECKHTLKDMFAKATHPERVIAGICLQVDPVEDKDCMVDPLMMPEQIRIKQVFYRDSQGANWARAEAFSLHQDEEYVLQIDSHMRFEPGWDETLIELLEQCPSEKPVISSYLPNYAPPDKRDYHEGNVLRIRVRRLGKDEDPQLVHVTGIPVPKREKERSGLYPTPFFIANFMFTRAQTLKEVPIDPHFHFYGDEISYGARLWTHGYDIFQLDRAVLFHYWVRKEWFHLHHYRNIKTSKSRRSLLRVRHLLGFEEAPDRSALVELDRYGLGDARVLDDWWAIAGIDWQKRTVTKKAEKGFWNMAAKAKAKPAKTKGTAKKSSGLPRIFVQIASYRDPDCQNTVKDLFEKAAHPERIFVGICWQFIKSEDKACFEVPYPYPKQVCVVEVDARESKGVCWARNKIQKLWEGEEFTLQIDSHMRFEPGWDDTLLAMWDQCENDKAILTCYPPGFKPPADCDRRFVFGMAAREFDRDGIFLMHGMPAYPAEQTPAKPMVGAFASACMYFGPSSMIEDVPYDPHLYFFGEEVTLAVRFFTHGYDLYHPNKLVIFHNWDRGNRSTHFGDHSNWGEANWRSFARVKHMLGTEQSHDPAALEELDIYGLGNKRTLAEYQDYSGVDFAAKTISEKAYKGDYKAPYQGQTAPNFAIGKSKGNERIFVQIASYRDPECQWTIKDLFERARDPERISVGVCWQFDEQEDQHCFEVSERPEQVRMIPVDWREAEGVCWARNQTQQLWDNEEYTLQIDSHMRFMQGWDDLLINELRACPSDKPVISCSPASYTPPNNLQANPLPTIRRVQPFSPDGNIRGKGEYIDRPPETPLNGAFIAAGFVFSKADIIPQVPYDPYLYFDQEEITYAARAYTHGWDVFSSRKPILYHYYNTDPKGPVRPLHWRDLRKEDEKRIAFFKDRGLQRFNHMTGHRQSSDPEVIRELSKYGFGYTRSLQQFEEYTGIDFKRKIASDRALRCQFIKDLPKYRARPIIIPEIDGDGKHLQTKANGVKVHQPPAQQQAQQQQPVQVAAPQEPKRVQQAFTTGKLEPGDFAPLFEVQDTNRKTRALELHGGKHTLLFFLPVHDHDFLINFFRNLHQQIEKGDKADVWQLFVLGDTVDNLLALKDQHKFAHVLWADPDHAIAQAFGFHRPGDRATPPSAVLLDTNLKVVRTYANADPLQLSNMVVDDARKSIDAHRKKFASPQVFTEVPPMLIVPNALSPELCKQCIEAFRSGRTFDGTVGTDTTGGYRPNAKVRTDFIVGGDLLRDIDDKLSRSLFPEIKKIFGFEVTNRENYKIGLYSGEKKGFFRPHRDNFDTPLGYRRIAMTIHLNDAFEGGGLRFPEYGDNIYRPATGSAITFSCATLHEALPVTHGERIILVGFFHGDEDEAYRRYYQSTNQKPLKLNEYEPTLRHYPGLNLSRDFYKDWRSKHVAITDVTAPAEQKAPALSVTVSSPQPAAKPAQNIVTIGGHKPKKVFESKGAIIFDDFLPEQTYEQLHNFTLSAEYEYINTHGKIARAWHIHDGFPLRSAKNLFYHAKDQPRQQAEHIYPTRTPFDGFAEHLLGVQPYVNHLTGKEGNGGWTHFSVSAWIYPQGTGLTMHDDGSGIYTGAYVYFLNPTWRSHWGGLLLMVDEEGNQRVQEFRNTTNQMEFYQKKWLQANNLDELIMEHGFAKCIFPKKNRIVFIANDAYHMVTRVNETAGDNVRMSLAGFFNRNKP